jgi:hypothetical protein
LDGAGVSDMVRDGVYAQIGDHRVINTMITTPEGTASAAASTRYGSLSSSVRTGTSPCWYCHGEGQAVAFLITI